MNSNENYIELNIQRNESHKDSTKPTSKRRRKKEPLRQKVLIGVLLFLFVVIGILFSPYMNAKTISLVGCNRYSLSEICNTISFHEGDNLILYNRSQAEKTLLLDPYIESADISLQLPDEMIITISERLVRGYVPYMGTYLYIDMYGRVLESQSSFLDTLPIINGLQFSSFELGELLPVENAEALDLVLQLSKAIEKCEMTDMSLEVDVSNDNNITIYTEGILFYLGTIDVLEQKVSHIPKIIEKMSAGYRGSVDLSDLDKPIIFKYLT